MILAAFLLGLLGQSLTVLGYPDLPRGACLCVTAARLNFRSSAGLSVRNILGTAANGECFSHTGKTSEKDGFSWVSIQFKGQEAWAARRYLKLGNISMCPSNMDACAGKGGPFNQRCLNCICQVESGCKPIGCHMDVGSLSCGYFQIKEPYYTDCYRPGSGWKTCANDLSCATQCVNNYINRYYGYCTGSPTPKCCEDAARIHNGGPKGCQKSATLGYWNKVQKCLGES